MKYPMKYALKSGADVDAFKIPFEGRDLYVIASHGGGWDHVSVSLTNRCPNWREMCFVKVLFFDKEDLVIQYLVPHPKHININQYTLHMWRPQDETIPMPPQIMV